MHDTVEVINGSFAEQAKEECLLVVKKQCDSVKQSGQFDLNKCLSLAWYELNLQFRKAKGYYGIKPRNKKEKAETDWVRTNIWPSIEQDVRKMVLSYGTKFRTLEITKVTAEAVIKAALADNGFNNVYVWCQCYRAKTYVQLPSKYKAVFMIRYKDIMAGKLQEQIDIFKEFIKSVESLPFQVKVWK